MVFLIFALVILIFAFVLLFGAPYLPTRKYETEIALDLLDLKRGQTLYELGCGDGRVMKAAARRGVNVVGFELNPILVLVAYMHTWRYRRQIKIIWGNFWQADISKADGIFVFLLDRFMKKLDYKINKETKQPIKLVSYAFKVPGKKEAKHKDGMFLYLYK